MATTTTSTEPLTLRNAVRESPAAPRAAAAALDFARPRHAPADSPQTPLASAPRPRARARSASADQFVCHAGRAPETRRSRSASRGAGIPARTRAPADLDGEPFAPLRSAPLED